MLALEQASSRSGEVTVNRRRRNILARLGHLGRGNGRDWAARANRHREHCAAHVGASARNGDHGLGLLAIVVTAFLLTIAGSIGLRAMGVGLAGSLLASGALAPHGASPLPTLPCAAPRGCLAAWPPMPYALD